MNKLSRCALAAVLMLVGVAGVVFAQDSSPTGLGVFKLRPNFYVIARAGGNIGVQIGDDGVVLVDSGSADMSDQIVEAVKKVTTQPIRYIINTNAEPDHVGGNEKIAKAGRNLNGTPPGVGFGTVDSGASILATEDVLNRMSASTGKQAAWPTAAWPTETFIQEEKPMYLNDEGIEVLREFAHSDADAIVFFRKSDVIMAGDIIDTTRFPVIDVEKGGSIQGEIKALNQLVKMAIPSIPLVWKDGGTYVVPGHGWIYDQPDVVEYRDMITIIADVVQDMIKQGMTLAQIQAANPTQGFRARYGTDSGPWTTNMFVEAIYKSLTAKGGK
jgi:glyoxylase-like metal-dependent hydrolase (beta-lactamase superfamily II)